MTQTEYEAELHFWLCKSIFTTLVIKGVLTEDDTGEQIVPVEVKAEVNLKAKDLKTYQEKFFPEVSVCTSMADYKKEEWLINLPLYAIDQITQI